MPDDEYARLFNARGAQYHAAMERWPDVRAAEFTTPVALAGIRPGDVVADIPCGGGYLARYLPDGITLWSVDSSGVFADCFRRSGDMRLLEAPITAVPLPDATLDHVISVAGLHHVDDRRPFWRECARLLCPGGTLVVCDVRRGSAVAQFLDTVVDRHTSTGHTGAYFDEATVAELAACGFEVTLAEPRRIPWRAPDRMQLAGFCGLLFGLEGIDGPALARELEAVGIRDVDGEVELDWELFFFVATRATAEPGSA